MKPEDVTKEMEVAFRQNVITTNRGSLIGLKAAIAAAINAMPQSAAQAQIDAAQEELRLCKQDAIKLQDECIADTPPKQSTELPEASPETKGICNTERACAACYSGQGDCEVTV
jgi:hypothetical protein